MSSGDEWCPDRRADAWPEPSAEPHRRQQLASAQPVAQPKPPQEQIQAPKLLQRPKDVEEVSRVRDEPAPKTLKQREAEYAATRARIFGTANIAKGPQGGSGYGTAGKARGGRGRQGGGGYQGGGGNQINTYQGGRGRQGGGGHQGYGGSSGRRKPAAEDANDPDYDRSTQRYAPRVVPSPYGHEAERDRCCYGDEGGDGVDDEEDDEGDDEDDHGGPVRVRYSPALTYENEFPALGK